MASQLPITVAIIGGGLIGPRHAQAVLKNPNTKLVALVDPAPHGPQLAADLKTTHYTSVAALLSSQHKPTAAIICTPNASHVSLSMELAAAGVHILVEKPISTTAQGGRPLVTFCHDHSIHLLVGHHRRFNPYIVATKSLLLDNTIGQVLAVSGLWCTYKPSSYFDPPTEWRRGKDAGVIMINLVHDIDVLQHLFGPICSVHAEKIISTRNYPAPEGAAIILKFESGVVGTFTMSDAAPSPFNFEAGTGENPTIPRSKGRNPFYTIFGTEGTLTVPDMKVYSYRGKEHKSWTEELDVQELEEKVDGLSVPFDRQIEDLVCVLRGEKAPTCTGEEGLKAVAVCEAVSLAMEKGMPVDLSGMSDYGIRFERDK